MFDGLRRFHFDQGGWVLNVAGNSIYREVEIGPTGDLRLAGMAFADSCADETAVLCVRHTDTDNATCAPYRVLRPDHWAFAGAPVPPSRLFGGGSLNQNTPFQSPAYDSGRLGLPELLDGCGASGWETDKLSPTAPADAVVIAKGENRFGGADMVIREPAGGRGGLFSASSIVFGGCLLIDEVASRLMRNVLERAMGAAD
jgi:hypothetical protein